ncbi:MAG: hypothetical protein Ct9H300mP3_05110 [Gammaproteobacteria bacterium]|nr:MAG: hypothetical protein Ct9H300mP3_05110 [Gammaproteobacteria bacterium]
MRGLGGKVADEVVKEINDLGEKLQLTMIRWTLKEAKEFSQTLMDSSGNGYSS